MQPKDPQEQFVCNLTDCQRSLYAYILSLVPTPSDARDILQDTNLVLWRRSGEFVEGTNFLAWAYKIARNKVLAHHRDHRRDRHVFDEAFIARLADHAQRRSNDPESVAGFLDECIEELSPNQRALIRERYALGGSVQEIARRLGQSAAALSVTLSRIRHTLLGCVQGKLGGRSRP